MCPWPRRSRRGLGRYTCKTVPLPSCPRSSLQHTDRPALIKAVGKLLCPSLWFALHSISFSYASHCLCVHVSMHHPIHNNTSPSYVPIELTSSIAEEGLSSQLMHQPPMGTKGTGQKPKLKWPEDETELARSLS